MLSFSTRNSAKHEKVDKVIEATKLAKEMAPELNIDGELQADAALIEAVGQLKDRAARIAGHANVLIFPDIPGRKYWISISAEAGQEQKTIGPICSGACASCKRSFARMQRRRYTFPL